MLQSRLMSEYGFNSTELNEACVNFGVKPIFLHSDFFINEKLEKVYQAENTINGIVFNEVRPYRIGKHQFPVYRMRNDLTGKWDLMRLDILYLYTFYGVLPKEAHKWLPSYTYSVGDLEYLKYHTSQISVCNVDTIHIYGVEFRRIADDDKRHIFVSEYGVVYNSERNRIARRTFDHKFYANVSINGKSYLLHRLIFMVWNNGNQPIPEGMQIDHDDGFKNHNWASNLKMVTSLENYRKAAYEQRLRSTKWNYDIIHFMCEQMQDPMLSGPTELLERVKKRFPDFDISYGAFKHKMYEIKNGENWKDVAPLYDVSAYDANRSTHRNEAISDDAIRAICEAKVSGRFATNKELARFVGINENLVNRVLRGEYRRDISSQYDIQYSEKKRIAFTEEEVRSICEDVMAGMTNDAICAKYGRTTTDVKRIINRSKFPEIGKHYHFETVRTRAEYVIPYDPN